MTCPHPQKTKYASEKAAKRALRSIKNPQGLMHPYRCGNHVHLGHFTPTKKSRKARR